MDQAQNTLLVVDDNAENRDMLSRRLQRRGYRVLTAEDGQAALDMVAEEPIELVLLDIMMPVMDGIEVLKILRQSHSQSELPVIMATAKDDSQDVVEALDLGANDYVTKPIDFPVVLARVQKELRASSGRKSEAEAAAEARQASEAESDSPGPGKVLAGKYRLDLPLGSGNFGTVYRGYHLDLDKPVAIKILQTRVQGGEESLARFRAEGQSACRVQHPNAVTVFDFGVNANGVAYMVMELLEGRTLSDEILIEHRLNMQRANEVLLPICAVLQQAHDTGVVHRDIKPDNIYVQDTSDGQVIKVLDFGIAKLIGDEVTTQNLTAEGYILGTPAYMSPERLRNEPYDGRSDIYSLGVMLFQMVTGSLPFRSKKGDPMALLMMHLNDHPPAVSELLPSAPPELDHLIARCLQKKPEDRPTLAELSREFDTFARQQSAQRVGGNTPDHGNTQDHGNAPDDGSTPDHIDEAAPTHIIRRPQEPSGFFGKLVNKLKKTIEGKS